MTSLFLRIFLVIFLIIFSQNIPHNISWDIFTWWGKEQEGRRRTRGLLRLLSTPALGGITSDHFYLPKITMILRGWFSSSNIRTTLRRRGDGYSVAPCLICVEQPWVVPIAWDELDAFSDFCQTWFGLATEIVCFHLQLMLFATTWKMPKVREFYIGYAPYC